MTSSVVNKFCRHDFNDSLGKFKLQPFRDKFPDAVADFQNSWIEYMKYCYRVESGEEVDMVAQNRPTHTLWELDRDVKGYPMLPPAREGDALAYMKKLIRSFITAHYRECQPLISFTFSFFQRLCIWPSAGSSALETHQRSHSRFYRRYLPARGCHQF